MTSNELSDESFFMGEPNWQHPIGGKIKSEPENFVVIELNNDKSRIDEKKDRTEEGGLFLSGNVKKIGTDHGKLIRVICEVFGVKEKDVSTSGLKDANAITLQRFSVFKPNIIPEDPFTYSNEIKFSDFRFQREKVYPGSMGGNYFKIKITECSPELLDFSKFKAYISNGILNYYGYQRFGSQRPISSVMGRLLSNAEYKQAVDTLIGAKSFGNDDKWRKVWRDTKDPKLMITEFAEIPLLEFTILDHLKNNSNDYQGAINLVPKYLILMFKSAFISELTNSYLSLRGINNEPLKGERSISNNIEIALPSQKWDKPLNEFWVQIFEEKQIQFKELRNIRHTSRNLILRPTEFKVENSTKDSLTVSFKLENGCYATTLLRELMQSNPLNYV